MNNSNRELSERIQELFEELRLLNESIPIIVEGRNDEEALREIGVRGEIIRLNIGHSILNFCEEISRHNDEVIILPDWDVKGEQLFNKLRQNFKYNNVKTVKKFWRDFKRFCSKEIHQVEYLTKFLND